MTLAYMNNPEELEFYPPLTEEVFQDHCSVSRLCAFNRFVNDRFDDKRYEDFKSQYLYPFDLTRSELNVKDPKDNSEADCFLSDMVFSIESCGLKRMEKWQLIHELYEYCFNSFVLSQFFLDSRYLFLIENDSLFRSYFVDKWLYYLNHDHQVIKHSAEFHLAAYMLSNERFNHLVLYDFLKRDLSIENLVVVNH